MITGTRRNASPDGGGKVKKVICMYCDKEFTQMKRKKVPVCFESACQEQLWLDRVKRSSKRDVKRKGKDDCNSICCVSRVR